MKNTFKKPIVATLAIALLLTGCATTKNSKKSNSNRKSEDREVASTEAYYDEGYSYNAGLSDQATIAPNYATEECDSDYQNLSNSSSSNNKNIPSGEMLIRTMRITADTEDFPALVDEIDKTVKTYGGYYDEMNVSGTGKDKDYRNGYFVIRVPADKLDALVNSIDGRVTITNRSEYTEDVTLTYVDIESRIESLRIELDDLMAMLEQAEDIDTIVYLQSQISDVRYEIESYESQARIINSQVSYSTLYLTLNEVIKEEEKEDIVVRREKTFNDEISETWSETVANLKENLKDAFLWVVSALPIIAPLCIIFLIIVIVVVIKIKKRKSNNKEKKDTNTITPSK